jgi:uncharacterized protein YbjT (DUF2867 family)
VSDLTVPEPPRILLTGATGYVGGRLLPLLVARGWRVRCLTRRPEALRSRAPEGVEIAQGDVLDADSLPRALEGVDSAVYLVHSMGSEADFAEADLRAARNFGAAARRADVRRIVYLGGLGSGGSALSPHLKSRQEVGEALRAAGLPVIELRASVILGSGSLSFEMIRALVERLPVMITPRWVRVPTQPIYINDVLAYLDAALERPGEESRVFEIGGPDVLSYGGLMQEYARQRGLRRVMIPVPFLTPRLSSLWLGLVTPLYARVGRSLIGSIRYPTVVRDPAALSEFGVKPTGVRDAMRKALLQEDVELARTRWSDAAWRGTRRPTWGGVRFGNRLVDSHALEVAASPAATFRAVEGIGGERGWYAFDFLWRLRGWIDLLVGGVGMRRGRRDPNHLAAGDWLDCWWVEAIEPGRRLRLAAEMRLPGRAWLEFEVAPSRRGASVRMTATFDPLGLAGLAYWYALWPLHKLIFAGMLEGLSRAAEEASAT